VLHILQGEYIMADKGYRIGAGAIIINDGKKILFFERMDKQGWQPPHGGLDEGETLEDCCFREVREETGITKDQLDLLGATKELVRHTYPADFNCTHAGQDQKWYLLKFKGRDSDINLKDNSDQTFSDFKWVTSAEAIDAIAYFKQDMLRAVLAEFGII
jgi:putative (di)nucleoside polyphosphate hydrolase